MAGAFRLRLTALFPEVLKKETLPHNQKVFLDMTLNFFSPSKPFANYGSLSDINKTSQKFKCPKFRPPLYSRLPVKNPIIQVVTAKIDGEKYLFEFDKLLVPLLSLSP